MTLAHNYNEYVTQRLGIESGLRTSRALYVVKVNSHLIVRSRNTHGITAIDQLGGSDVQHCSTSGRWPQAPVAMPPPGEDLMTYSDVELAGHLQGKCGWQLSTSEAAGGEGGRGGVKAVSHLYIINTN